MARSPSVAAIPGRNRSRIASASVWRPRSRPLTSRAPPPWPGRSPSTSSWSTWPRSASASACCGPAPAGRAAERSTTRSARPSSCLAPPVMPPPCGPSWTGSIVHSVLTAHPTEARRRTLLVALRRIRRLLDELDAPLTTPDEDADLRRRIREEISLLWHTGDLRAVAPTPLDEVRSALAIFDETLFTVVPRFQRAVDRALDARAASPRGAERRQDPEGPATGLGAGLGNRHRADRHARRGRARAPAVRLLDRGRPRRAPGRDLGRDPPGRPAPGRAPAPRLRVRRPAPHADRGGPGAGGAARPGARQPPGPRRRGASRDDAPAACAASPRSRTGSGWARSRSACGARGRRSPARRPRGPAATPTPRPWTPSSPSSRTRSRRTALRASRTASWPTCAGRWRRSGSTSPRSRYASTRTSIARRSRRLSAGPARTTEVAAGRHAGRGPGHVPGRSRASRRASAWRPAAGTSSRSRPAPGTCATVLDLARQGRRTGAVRGARAGSRGSAAGDPRPRRRAAAGVRRGAGRGRSPARRAALGPGLPGAPAPARRRPGGDARLLGLVQGERVPGRQLAPLPGPGGARGDGAATRRGPHAVPRAGRGDRAWRRAGEPRDPGPGPGLGERAPQVHRAGRGDRRPLRRPDDRAAAPGAGDGRDAARLHARARGRAGRGRGGRCGHHDGAGRDLAHGLPVAGGPPRVRVPSSARSRRST